MKHDTKGLIARSAKRMAKQFVKEQRSDQLWWLRHHLEYTHRTMTPADRSWLRNQRPSYQSTIRWRIFIQFVDEVCKLEGVDHDQAR